MGKKGMGRTVTRWWGGGSYGNDNRTHRRLERRLRDRETEQVVADEVCQVFPGWQARWDWAHAMAHREIECPFTVSYDPRFTEISPTEHQLMAQGREFFSSDHAPAVVWVSQAYTPEMVEHVLGPDWEPERIERFLND